MGAALGDGFHTRKRGGELSLGCGEGARYTGFCARCKRSNPVLGIKRLKNRENAVPDLHITLLSAGIAALINLWLSVRCGRARIKGQIAHGDGGNVTLQRAMRAHSNFTEYAPIMLVLVFVLEITGHSGWLLGVAAGLFLVGRIFHAIGLDADKPGMPRLIGMLCTLPILLALAIAAILAGVKLI